jgi:hypothetical protein
MLTLDKISLFLSGFFFTILKCKTQCATGCCHMSSKKFVNVQNKRNEFWPMFKPLITKRLKQKATDGAIRDFMGWPTTQKVLRYRDGTNTPSTHTLDQIKGRLNLTGETIKALARACDHDIKTKRQLRAEIRQAEAQVIENKGRKSSTRTQQLDIIDTDSDFESQIISIDEEEEDSMCGNEGSDEIRQNMKLALEVLELGVDIVGDEATRVARDLLAKSITRLSGPAAHSDIVGKKRVNSSK